MSSATDSEPLLFKIKEDTHIKAFLYSAVVVGLSTAATLEFRLQNPFGVYPEPQEEEKSKSRNILVTSLSSSLFTFFVLFTLHALFGLGDAWVMNP